MSKLSKISSPYENLDKDKRSGFVKSHRAAMKLALTASLFSSAGCISSAPSNMQTESASPSVYVQPSLSGENKEQTRDEPLYALDMENLQLHCTDNPRLRGDKDLILREIRKANEACENEDGFSNDELLKTCMGVLAYDCASDSLKKDRELVMVSVSTFGWMLEDMDDSFKKDKELVMAAVRNHGMALKYADDSLKKDPEVVMAAVKNNALALLFADVSLKKDKGIVLEALKKDKVAVTNLITDPNLLNDPEIQANLFYSY